MTRFLLTLYFVFAFAACALCADTVSYTSLVDFGVVFDDMTDWFCDILKRGWLLFLSLSFIWFIWRVVLLFLDVREERLATEVERSDQVESMADEMNEQGIEGSVNSNGVIAEYRR